VHYLGMPDVLHLRDNYLSGTIPAEVFCPRLRSLDFSRNQLTGKLPSAISQSPRLRSIQLHRNSLSGSLPSDAFSALDELALLNLSTNKFTGGVPAAIGRLQYLEFTSFIDSGLSGPIPESYCEQQRNSTRQVIGDCQGEAALVANCTCCAGTYRGGVSVLCSESFPKAAIDRILQ
jgi:hypothetical protein